MLKNIYHDNGQTIIDIFIFILEIYEISIFSNVEILELVWNLLFPIRILNFVQ